MSTESLRPAAIFWDIENCAVPHGVNAEEVGVHIRRTFKVNVAMQGPIRVFSAYGDFSRLPRHTRQGCQKTGVNLIDIPNGTKDAADKAILADMFLFALDNPPPGTILLISGDVDFAPALHKLGQRGYSVVLAIPSGLRVSPALCNACQHLLSWPDVARGKSLTCINNDVKPSKVVVTVKEDCTDHFKSRYVAKDISNGGALGKHQSDHNVVTGPKNVVEGTSCIQNTSEVTRKIPDGICEEQIKIPSRFAKVFEAIAMHGQVPPFIPQDMHGNAHDASTVEAGCVGNVGHESTSKRAEHHRKFSSSDLNSRGSVTRLQNAHNNIRSTLQKCPSKHSPFSPCKINKKKDKKEKLTFLCKERAKTKKTTKKWKGHPKLSKRGRAAARLAGLEHVRSNIRIVTESFLSYGV